MAVCSKQARQGTSKVKKKAAILDDGDSISITFRAGEDNTIIETLKIPEQLEKIEHLF